MLLVPFRVVWLPHTWEKCLHGCGRYCTEICRIGIDHPSGQVSCVVCYACLARMARDKVFAKEVAACL